MSDSPQFTLRSATKDDTGFLFSLYASTRRKEMAALGWDSQQEEAFLRMQFDAQRLWYEQAYDQADHSIVVFGEQRGGRWIVLRKERAILLVDVALLPEFQGRGVGTGLLHLLIRESEEAAQALRLQVGRTNPARRLYERLGFLAVGEDQIYCQMERKPTAR
jgi:ribosomal protein S18 acetylase RimI-like enzyme